MFNIKRTSLLDDVVRWLPCLISEVLRFAELRTQLTKAELLVPWLMF